MPARGEQTRERILDCAEKLFSQKGYYETSLSDIVEMMHVARGTIYLHFLNKDDIFVTLLKIYIHDWEKANMPELNEFACDKTKSIHAIELLLQRLRKNVDYWAENRDRTNIILRIAVGLNKDIENIIGSFENKMLNVIIGDIKSGQKWGTIPDNIDVEIAGIAILGIVIRMTRYFFVNKRDKSQDIDKQDLENALLVLISNLLGIKTREIRLGSIS